MVAVEKPGEGKEWTRSIRFTFAYEGTKIRLLKRENLKKVPPGSQRPAPQPGMSGCWCELWDAAGKTLYYRILGNPLASYREVYEGDRGEPTRVEVSPVEGEFDLVVPDDPNGRSLVLFASPPGRDSAGKAAVEVGRFKVP